jgi:DNA-binding NtrC family response regulator
VSSHRCVRMSREMKIGVKLRMKGASPLGGLSPINLGSDTIAVLSVSPIQDDHDTLERILSRNNWVIQKAHTLVSGVAKLRQNRFPVVLCERDLMPGTWREMLAEAERLPPPPFLIVASRLADESLWAEALNIGAYDVLAKPFDTAEVVRIVSLAWLHWKDRYPFDRWGVERAAQ